MTFEITQRFEFSIAATMQQSPIKMKLALNGTNINQCKNVYQTVTVGASQLCAGGEEGKDSCSGDSG